MSFRNQEFEDLGLSVHWLESEQANETYEIALTFASKKEYGLNPETVADIKMLVIENDLESHAWLKNRMSSEGKVQVAFSSNEVCEMAADDFLDNWQDMFVPARDDVLILHSLDETILFYSHEEELHIGKRLI